jgi:NitT/TauT family transport system permease protein
MGVSKTDIGTTIVSIIATLVAWEVLCRLFNVPSFILPTPSAIFIEAVTRYPLYLYHSWVTFYEMVVGFLLAALVGVFLAVVIVYSRIVRNMIYPQIVVLQIVPKVAIAPLLLIWAGYGMTSKILLALLISFFPIVVNMVTGLMAVAGRSSTR